MTISKNNVGTIEYSIILNNTMHPSDTIKKQKDLGFPADTKSNKDDTNNSLNYFPISRQRHVIVIT